MAMRGGAMRRMPGNPLGGMLRDLDRRTRTTTRSTGRRAPAGDPPAGEAGSPGERGPEGPPGRSTTAAIVTTGDDGRARWMFPAPYALPPVLTALPVDPEPGGDRTVTVALEEVTETCAVVRVWRTRPKRGHGVTDPAGPGLFVHLTATAVS
ncbi:hypothetical protein OG272_15595 [Streptomyces sp. NBC_00104]|uniref:hypothetical protein n=1 Tax=Streptomyces sp. NBC_00104 TaxID=2903621 RepID=UPI003247AA40